MAKIHNLSDLKPDNKNANKGTKRGLGMVESSLRETGAGRSIVVDKAGRVIAGNKTLESWMDIADPDDVVVVQTDGNKLVVVQRSDLDLSDDTGSARKLAMYDNRAGELGLEWDASELFASMQDGLDLSTFWNDDELQDLFADFAPEEAEPADAEPADAEPQIDRAEELREQWGVELGQLWRIGEHRLICGDCTDADVVARVMGGEKAQCAFTSPPYAEQRNEQYGGVPTDEYVGWWDTLQANVKENLADDGSFFVNIKAHCEDGQRVLYCMNMVISMVEKWKWLFVDELCWKRQGVPGKWPSRFKNGFEPIYHFSLRKDIKFRPNSVSHKSDSAFSYTGGGEKAKTGSGFFQGHTVDAGEGAALPSNVLDIPAGNQPGDSKMHSATFPIKLPEFFINAYSDIGDIWMEPFAGSGTTIIACQNLSRKCRAIELSAPYCAVILQRMQDAFPDIEIERL